MGNLGATELILIFLVVLLVFGAKRIPEIARGMGKGIREFKDATTDIKKELTVSDAPQLNRSQPPAYGQPQTYQPAASQPQPATYAAPAAAAEPPPPVVPVTEPLPSAPGSTPPSGNPPPQP